jgi:hypothetical protein
MLAAISFLATQAPPRDTGSYWQQEVHYDISARLDEPAGVLSGTERIVYLNRSPDTLTTFSLHLYLNAFRPGSRWADADSIERRRRYNDLQDPDYGFNHVRQVVIMGQPVESIYPLAPDSTIVRFRLPAPLLPGDSMSVELEWDARPSTLPRRQGRQGRRFDFAQWYPKVVVYDRHGWNEHALYPAGEFYGEFGSFLVQLDVPADQVVGATGVPVCGDPGWEQANQVPDQPIHYRRDYYSRALTIFDTAKVCGPRRDGGPDPAVAPGRKKVVWYAEAVHHFAMSLNPAYRYEGGWWGNVAIHLLYQPGDEETWGRGIAVRRTAAALEWLDGFFGEFAWPQITNVHRIEGGGTEFPMMIHDGSAGQGLIVHELGHNYVMGILANNEWREGWLDEGFTSYQSTLFDIVHGGNPGRIGGLEAFLTGLDLDGVAEPASLVSEKYRDFTSYNISIYQRGEWFFHQLESIVGPEVMHRIMRTYYQRWKLRHVDEAAFRQVAEDVSGLDLAGFFAEALHGTALVDYAVGRVRVGWQQDTAVAGYSDGRVPRRQDTATAGWVTKVEVLRKAPGHRPVDLWVLAQSDTALARADGVAEREWVEVATRTRPREVLVDPAINSGDWDMLNNVRRLGFHPLGSGPAPSIRLDTWFSLPQERDRLTAGFMPVVWFNDAGGVTLGARVRQDYFGRFEQNVLLLTASTGWGNDVGRGVHEADFFVRVQNPVRLRSPGLTERFEGYHVEGRFGADLALERSWRDHLSFGPTRQASAELRWLQPDDFRYLDRGYYEDAGVVEFTLGYGVTDRLRGWDLAARATGGGGLVYARTGLLAVRSGGDLAPFYGRGAVTFTAHRTPSPAWSLGGRLVLTGTVSEGTALKQRQAYAAGADPFEQFDNPFLRSRGALLTRTGVYYQAPGGGGVRAFDPRLSSRGLAAATVEVERSIFRRPGGKLLSGIGLAVFGDGAASLAGEFSPVVGPIPAGQRAIADLGIGLRTDHRIGRKTFTVRFDMPFWVSAPLLAQDNDPGNRQFGFRWLASVGGRW